MPRFQDIAKDLDQIMGIKAVWGRSSEAVMCFGSRGNPEARDPAHFTQARITAEKAVDRPYLVTIGAGENVPPELDGRVIELVRVTLAYGETKAFVRDPALLNRLNRWPVAVVLMEVFAIEGEPHLIDDLGFKDRRILTNAYDRVLRDEDQISHLWNTIRHWSIQRRAEIAPLPGFRAPESPRLCSTLYPTLLASSTEGRRVWRDCCRLERDKKWSRVTKDANRIRNGGVVVCESCGLANQDSSLFDAHHLEPLATGVRETRHDDLVVLCPTCHRWAHYLAEDWLQPLSIHEVRERRLKSISNNISPT